MTQDINPLLHLVWCRMTSQVISKDGMDNLFQAYLIWEPEPITVYIKIWKTWMNWNRSLLLVPHYTVHNKTTNVQSVEKITILCMPTFQLKVFIVVLLFFPLKQISLESFVGSFYNSIRAKYTVSNWNTMQRTDIQFFYVYILIEHRAYFLN